MKTTAWVRGALLATVTAFSLFGYAAEKPGYHISKTTALQGTGSYYDYVYFEQAQRRLFVSYGDSVVVLDGDSLSVIATLTGFIKVHGMVVAPKTGWLFATDGGADVVRVFETKTFKLVGQVKTGKNPDAVFYDHFSKHVFAVDHGGGTTTVIDPSDLSVVASIDVGGTGEFGRADGKGTVWINLEDKHEIVRIDSIKNIVTARWPLSPCEAPTGLAFDAKGQRLFVGCGNKMTAVVNSKTGKVITTLPIGPGVDATEFDPATKTLFNSSGAEGGSLSLIHQKDPDHYFNVATLATQERAKTMAVDLQKHRVFLTAASFGKPPAPSADHPKPRAPMVPGSLQLLLVEP